MMIRNNRIVSMGYNGAPKGLPHCEEIGCLMVGDHCKRAVHAEVNALQSYPYTDPWNVEMWVTHQPCIDCLKLFLTVGIKQVKYFISYHNPILVQYLEEVKEFITVEKVDETFAGSIT